jgi:hypothetical protein
MIRYAKHMQVTLLKVLDFMSNITSTKHSYRQRDRTLELSTVLWTDILHNSFLIFTLLTKKKKVRLQHT